MLDPQSIDQKTFTIKLRGYDQDEVDNFLDDVQMGWRAVVNDYTSSQVKITQLERKIRELEMAANAPTMEIPSTASAQRLLDLAQRAHDEQIAQAKQEASEIKGQARVEALTEKDRILRGVEDERRALQTQVDQLTELKRNLLTAIDNAREALA